jgi:hypothetical protein
MADAITLPNAGRTGSYRISDYSDGRRRCLEDGDCAARKENDARAAARRESQAL